MIAGQSSGRSGTAMIAGKSSGRSGTAMIAGKTWRELRVMAIAYTLMLELLLVPAILLWPSFRGEGGVMLRLMPKGTFLAEMAQAMSTGDAAAYRAYMAVQMFFKGTNVVGIACAVLLGTGLIARERENGTLEFLLSRPFGRARVLWGKFLVAALITVVPIFVTSWTALPLSRLPSVDEQLPLAGVMLGSLHAGAFVLMWLAFTVMCSVLFRTQVHVAFVAGAVIVLQVAIFFIQEIRAFSLLRLSDFLVYGPVVAGNVGFGQLFFSRTIWCLGIAAACGAVAAWRFRRLPL
jgi:ABC-type transport system involved in multi-copper enzyme maturation permease subunit